MLRPAPCAIVLAAIAVALAAAPAIAASNPSPPPGTIGIQPTTVSAGSPAQQGTSATVSTQSADAGSDGQNVGASHCGASGSAGGQGTSAQPESITTAGSSTPSCGGGAGAPGSGQTTTSSQGAHGYGSGSANTGSAGETAGSSNYDGDGRANLNRIFGTGDFLLGSSGNDGLGLLATAALLGLLLLLALFFVLLGVAIGRRRQHERAAA